MPRHLEPDKKRRESSSTSKSSERVYTEELQQELLEKLHKSSDSPNFGSSRPSSSMTNNSEATASAISQSQKSAATSASRTTKRDMPGSSSNQDTEAETFIQPRKVRKNLHPKQNLNKEIPTKNYYNALSSSDDDSSNSDDETNAAKTKPQKTKPQPPIIVEGHLEHQHATEVIRKTVRGQFSLKYTDYNTCIYIHNKTERENFIEYIKGKAQFYTYACKEEKTHAFVLKGLCETMEPSQIENDLNNQGISVAKCYKLKTNFLPLFMVVTGSDVKLKDFAHKVKYILNTCVKIERFFNKKGAIQCHRCQLWGHAQSNCFRKPKCHKCAGDHLYTVCEKTKETPAKCVNCQGDHPASSTVCEAYKKHVALKKRVENGNKQSESKNSDAKYKPAPLPKTNPWHERARKLNEDANMMPTSSQQRSNNGEEPSVKNVPNVCEQVSADLFTDLKDVQTLISELSELNKIVNIKSLIEMVKQIKLLIKYIPSEMLKTSNN